MIRAKKFNTEIAKTHPIETGHLQKEKKKQYGTTQKPNTKKQDKINKRGNKEFNITKLQTRISTYEGNRDTTQARIKTEVVYSKSERNNNI